MPLSVPAVPESTAEAPDAPVPTSGQSAVTVEALSAIAELVVHAFPACDHACVLVTPRPGVELAGISDPGAADATEVMRLLAADVPESLLTVDQVDLDDLTVDDPWPHGGSMLREGTTVRSLVVRRLVSGDRFVGAIVLMAEEPGALAAVDRAQLRVLTQLVSGWVVAHQSAAHINHLQRALSNARLMGRAIGILMGERGMLSGEAVAYLRTMSNRLNVRVRDLAAGILASHDAKLGARRVAASAETQITARRTGEPGPSQPPAP